MSVKCKFFITVFDENTFNVIKYENLYICKQFVSEYPKNVIFQENNSH